MHAEGTESLYPANRKVCNAFSSVVCGGRGGLGQYITMCVEFQNCQKKELARRCNIEYCAAWKPHQWGVFTEFSKL